MTSSLRIAPDAEAAARAAAEVVVERAEAAVAERGAFTWALAGGGTPRRLYELLASEPALRDRMPWAATRFVWGDERPVPPEHPESNFRMAWAAMLAHVPALPERLHRWPAERPPEEAARAYEATLRQALGLTPGELPRFDLVLLGLGADGHVASLFPGSPVLAENERLTAAPWVESLGTYRLTLTPPAFAGARSVLFLVTGKEKAAALGAALAPEGDSSAVPARAIRPAAGGVHWIVDQAAANRLQSPAELF